MRANSVGQRLDRSGNCSYCGCAVFPPGSPSALANQNVMATRDHIIPQRLNGAAICPTEKARTVIACHACNCLKSHYPEEVFRFWIERHPGGSRTRTREQFKDFIFALILTGFRVACADALKERNRKEPPPRGERGRFVSRVDRARARAIRARAA